MSVTAEEVGKIIEVDVSIDLTPFIEVAVSLVAECCGEAGYTDERIVMIEKWLAAHFYTNRDPRTTSEGAGVSVSYQNAVSLGFDTSHYGQTAMRLDTAGGLARLNEQIKKGSRKSASINWLGTENDEVEE